MNPMMYPILSLALLMSAALDSGQDRNQDAIQTVPPSIPLTEPGETPQVGAGQTGLRQSREQVAADTGIEPMGRINGRIQNRVQARIRNRIDRYYDPVANATSPFAVASEQATKTGRSSRVR
jgi:hypothetical protein